MDNRVPTILLEQGLPYTVFILFSVSVLGFLGLGFVVSCLGGLNADKVTDSTSFIYWSK